MTQGTSERPQPSKWEKFKNFAIIFSFIVNVILVLVLLIAPFPALVLTHKLGEPLLNDLDTAFADLGKTVIKTQVQINDTLPVRFTLPLRQNTDVILTEEVPLSVNATFYLPGGGGAINGTVQLNLPKGLVLPVSLDLQVPVSTTVPVVMTVPVEIPLDEAGMGPAIEELRDVFRPLSNAIESLPLAPKEVATPQ